MAICLFLALSVAAQFGAEEPLDRYGPTGARWAIAFERPAGLQASAAVAAHSWIVQLPAQAGACVGLSSSGSLPSQDLSAFEEIHMWVRSDAAIAVQPFTQSSGWVFRDGGFADLRLRSGEVTMLRVRADSIADPAMVQSIGIQVRPRTSPSSARLELLAVTAVRRTLEAPLDLAITSVSSPGEAYQYQIHTTSFTLGRTYENPYDPSEIDVQAEFELPSGRKLIVPAYWFQDYTVVPGTEKYEQYLPQQTPCWRVRFLATEQGSHTIRLRARDGSGSSTDAGPFAFEVQPSSLNRGPVLRHPENPVLLSFANGARYNPRGYNIAFEDGNPDLNGTSYYDALLSSLAGAGANWTRFWMTDFARTALEWGRNHFSGFYSGAGVYSQRAAWRVDRFLDLALARDIQVQLVLNDHGQFSTHVNARWNGGNPYGSAEGGPVPQANPELFFTDPTARDLFRRRLRYAVARWGAYPNLLCWELWNEVQFAGSATHNFQGDSTTRAAIIQWHREMSEYLKAQDPFGHMVTTSSDDPGSSGWAPIWNLASMDMVQSHHYAQPAATRDLRIVQYLESAQQLYGKPVIIAEMGMKASAEPECNFDPESFLADPNIPVQERTPANRDHLKAGTTLRNAVWAASMRAAGAMNWWWGCYLFSDPVRHRVAPEFPLNERVFPALAEFWGGEDSEAALQQAPLDVRGDLVGYDTQGASRAFLWLRDTREAYNSGFGPASAEKRILDGGAVVLSGLNLGTYVVSPFATTAGASSAPEFLVSSTSAGQLEVMLPPVTGDIALKIGRGTERGWAAMPRAAKTWTTAQTDGNAESGYARMQRSPGSPAARAGAILTFVQGGNPTSDFMVPAVLAGTGFWSVAEIAAPAETGLALVNPGSATAVTQVQLFSEKGIPAGSQTLELAPGAHVARFLYEVFPEMPGPFRGTVHVTSNVPLAALTLRGTQNSRQEFVLTTLPSQQDSAAEVNGSRVLPQVADGDGYRTELLLLNPYGTQLQGKLVFYRSDGRPWAIDVSGSPLVEQSYSIAPHGLQRAISSGAAPKTESGYCVLVADGASVPAAAAVISVSRPALQSETGVPFVVPSASASTYWEAGDEVFTGIAFANNSSETRRVRVEVFARAGIEQRLQTEIELPAGAHVARLVTELWPELPLGHGMLRYSSDGPIAFMSLRIRKTPRGDELTSSLRMEESTGSDPLIFPQMVVGGGYELRFVVLNPGDTTTEGMLSFYSSSGAPARVLFK